MKIKLKSLTLINFKGARKKTVKFTDNTFVFGTNATGKTTIFDAFTWLLFGKDSENRQDFGIKTLDERGTAIPQIDHEVTGVLEIDGKETTFRRVLKEKWVKKRGFEQVHFEGNETTYFVDDVPLGAAQYKAKVSELLDENVFKLITSPFAFNALKWQDRRAMLIEMAGGIEQDAIIKSMDSDADQKQWLINLLASDKTMDDHKKQIAAQIKRDKDELKMIPTRIDEAERSKPAIPEGGFGGVRLQLKEKTIDLDKVNEKIHDASKAVQGITDEIAKEKQTLYNTNTQIENIQNEGRTQAKADTTVDTSVLDNLKAGKQKEERHAELLKGEIETIENDIERKRAEWSKVNAEVFNAKEKTCPTCSREYEADKVAGAEAAFSKSKKERLDALKKAGEDAGTLKKVKENLIVEITKDIEGFDKQIEAVPSQQSNQTLGEAYDKFIEGHELRKNLLQAKEESKNKIKALEDQMGKPDETLAEQVRTINTEIEAFKATLRGEETIEKTDKRIKELGDQEKTLAQSIASVERSLFVLDKYNKSSIEALEDKINVKFSMVKFKMFELQINGGEAETCVCTLDGVPYSDLNTAAKINAGLDIINTLSDHFQVTAPIFVDGRESVIELIPTGSQIINLVVSEDDVELRIA